MMDCSLRRRILLFFLLPFLVESRSSSRAAFIPNLAVDPILTQRPRSADHGNVPLTQLRAGGILPLATTTAKAASALLGVNGALLLTNPDGLLENIYGIQPENSESKTLTTYMLRFIGVLGLGVCLQVYASIVAGVDAQTAMGLGLIPRVIFFLYTILSGQMKELGIQQRFFTINTVLATWCTVSLLFDLGNPAQTAKIYSLMCFLKATLFVLAPAKVSVKLLGKPYDGQALAVIRGAGNDLMASALFMMSSAWGASLLTPVVAAGYICLVWVLLLADMAFVNQTWRLMVTEGPRAQLINMMIAGMLAAGFLLPK